jgi:putative salt-induced outer membrane protein YdiY
MRLVSSTIRVSLFSITALALAGPASAADEPVADGQWRGSAGAALSATSGNTRSSAVLLNADLSRLTEADKISLGGNIQYARSEVDGRDETTANQLGAFGQYDFNLSPRLFAFGGLALDRDEVVDLDARVAVNAGLGWKLVDRKALRFSVFGGAGLTDERYGAAQTIAGETGKQFRRATLLLAEESEHALSASTSFKQRLELLPGISGDKGNRATLRADLAVAINRTMSLTVGLLAGYNGEPPAGQTSTDTSLFTGLNVKLGAE